MPKLERTHESLEQIGRRVCSKYEEGLRAAYNFRQRIDLLAPYIEPTRANVISSQGPGEALLSRMYDSEGISSADLAVRQIGSYLHGPGTSWYGLEDANPLVNQDDEAREWYEDCRNRMLSQYQNGSFYPEAYESDMDWLGFGTGLMRIEENPMLPNIIRPGFRGARFQHHKAGRFVCFENGIGQIDETYLEIRKSARAAKEIGFDISKVDAIAKAYEYDKPDLFRFIHGVYPRKPSEALYGNRAMPYASCYVHYDTKTVVRESGYTEFPDCVPRWSRCYAEPYGRGLGEIALNTLLTLNTATKHDLEAMALRIKPALAQRHDAVIGPKRFTPWGVTVVRTAPGEAVQNAISPINTNMGSYSFNQIDAEKLKLMIRRIFYADALQQLMALEGQQEMRVYVFQQKQNIIQKMLGPTYGRWEAEFGIPIVARLFNMMYRAKMFAPPPSIILELGGQPQVRFDSPLARAQRMEEVESLNQAMQDLMPAIQLQLTEWKMTGQRPVEFILDRFSFDKYSAAVVRNRGVPATVTRSEREIMALRQSFAENAQAQQMGNDMAQAAESAGKAAPMLKTLLDAEAQGSA